MRLWPVLFYILLCAAIWANAADENLKPQRKPKAGYSRVKEKNKVSLRPHVTVGVSGIFSSAKQGARVLETSDDSKYDITEFNGTSTFFRIFADLPIEDDWAGRISLVLREAFMKGNAQLSGAPTVYQFELEQKFIGVEGLLKRYLGGDKWWLGGSLEASKGTAVSLKTTTAPPINDNGLEKPFFTILSFNTGYDFRVFGKDRNGKGFYLTPELRLGGVVTTDPITYLTEFIVNGAWAF
jgi:hypothetical protein